MASIVKLTEAQPRVEVKYAQMADASPRAEVKYSLSQGSIMLRVLYS